MWAWSQKTIHKIFPTSFGRAVFYSFLVHVFVFLILTVNITSFRMKVPEKPLAAQVVWTRTVKAPKPTPPDKLPPPDVPTTKPAPKEEKVVNIQEKKKEEPKKDEKIDRQKKLQEALEKMESKIQDDRPIPKDDNFEAGEEDTRHLLLSADEVSSIKASSELISYTELLRAMVVENFLWYQSNKDFVTEIQIQVQPNGAIANTKILQSSGNASFDQATLRAIEKSSPLPAPTGKLVQLFQQEAIVLKFNGSDL